MMMLKCIKQQLSNIWRTVHGKVKQHWGLNILGNILLSGNPLDPLNPNGWLEHMNSKNDWNIKKATQSKQNMLKFHKRITRIWTICLRLTIKTWERRHWPRSDFFIVSFTYFTRYSSVSIVDFEQVNVC